MKTKLSKKCLNAMGLKNYKAPPPVQKLPSYAYEKYIPPSNSSERPGADDHAKFKSFGYAC